MFPLTPQSELRFWIVVGLLSSTTAQSFAQEPQYGITNLLREMPSLAHKIETPVSSSVSAEELNTPSRREARPIYQEEVVVEATPVSSPINWRAIREQAMPPAKEDAAVADEPKEVKPLKARDRLLRSLAPAVSSAAPVGKSAAFSKKIITKPSPDVIAPQDFPRHDKSFGRAAPQGVHQGYTQE